MPSYHVAPSLQKLLAEVNAAYPNRDKSSDGALGDAAHRARRTSDHNPDYSAGGVIRARDFDEDLNGRRGSSSFQPGDNVRELRERLLERCRSGAENRVYYLISERKIYQWKNGYAPRPYSGPNAHDHHLHVSIRAGRKYENDESSWDLTPAEPVGRVSLAAVQEAFRDGTIPADRGAGDNDGVQVQRALNKAMGTDLVEDGELGRNSRAVAAAFQAKTFGAKRPWTPTALTWDADANGILGRESLKRLGFEVIS